MNINFIVFLTGLFGVPIALLAVGHRLRRRSPRVKAMFRGAVLGHCVAGVVAVVWGMIPPAAWEPTDAARGFAGLWSLLVFPVVGALAFSLRARHRTVLALVGATLTLHSHKGAALQQQSKPALVTLVGHWTTVDDGGTVYRVDGTKWSGTTDSVALRAAAAPLYGSLSRQFVANATAAGAFPLAVSSDVADFREGTVSVQFKLVGGASDQNAGVVLGLQPNGDYLFVRYNTKDGNVAVWQYTNGERRVLTHGEHHQQLTLGAWQELSVMVRGNKVTGSVVGTSLTVEHTLDKPLTGRVGVWTKRDAITAFRNLRVNALAGR